MMLCLCSLSHRLLQPNSMGNVFDNGRATNFRCIAPLQPLDCLINDSNRDLLMPSSHFDNIISVGNDGLSVEYLFHFNNQSVNQTKTNHIQSAMQLCICIFYRFWQNVPQYEYLNGPDSLFGIHFVQLRYKARTRNGLSEEERERREKNEGMKRHTQH